MLPDYNVDCHMGGPSLSSSHDSSHKTNTAFVACVGHLHAKLCVNPDAHMSLSNLHDQPIFFLFSKCVNSTAKQRPTWDLLSAPMCSSTTLQGLRHPKENKSSDCLIGHLENSSLRLTFSLRFSWVFKGQLRYLQFNNIQIHVQI